MLSRLIYSSECARPLNPQDVQAILDTARRNNRQRDLTGMLVFNSTHFLQAVEGGRQALSDLYARLVGDSRHHRLQLMAFEPIAQRAFGDWEMGFAASDAVHAPIYLRHTASRQLDPRGLSGAAAMALLADFSSSAAR
jgi:hypothetical protein